MSHVKENGKKFADKLSKMNDYLADNKWISNFYAETEFEGDEIINSKSKRPDFQFKFKVLDNGLLKAVEIENYEGNLSREVYIGAVLPGNKTFEFRGVDNDHIITGFIDCKSNSITIQEFKEGESEFEMYNLAAASL